MKTSSYRNDPGDCFRQMFISWKTSSNQAPKAWSTLANVLRQPSIRYDELAVKIEERYCQPQKVKTGEKRPHPSDESETATKRSRLGEGYKCEELKELLLTKDQQIHELISEQNEKLKGFESSMKDRNAQIQALVKDNKQLRNEKAKLKQQCSELEKHIKENSEQLQQLTIEIQKLKSEKMLQQKECTSNLSPFTHSLTTDMEYTIYHMRRALHQVKEDWYDIGWELKVGLQFLDSIQREHSNNSKQCLYLVLREWLKQRAIRCNKGCEWCGISLTLVSPLLKHYDLARFIHESFHPQCEPEMPDDEFPNFGVQ